MITVTSNIYDVVSQLSGGAVETFHNVTWDEYEELLEQVGEASGLRISYNDETLKVMSLSPTHEKYAHFIEEAVHNVSQTIPELAVVRKKLVALDSSQAQFASRGDGRENFSLTSHDSFFDNLIS